MKLKINPFEFRQHYFVPEKPYESFEEAFDNGAYGYVVANAPVDLEVTACAMVLGGFEARGYELLRDNNHISERARFYKGVAQWLQGADKSACKQFDELTQSRQFGKMAKSLSSIIKNKENVVFVNSVFPGAKMNVGDSHNGAFAVRRFGNFLVKRVGTQLFSNAYSYQNFESFSEFIEELPREEKPILLLSETPQWLLPRHFDKVDIPKVLWVHDSDEFIAGAKEFFEQFDVLITHTAQEKFELEQGLATHSVTNLNYDPTFAVSKAKKSKRENDRHTSHW